MRLPFLLGQVRTVAARCVNDEAKQSEHTSDGVLLVYLSGTE